MRARCAAPDPRGIPLQPLPLLSQVVLGQDLSPRQQADRLLATGVNRGMAPSHPTSAHAQPPAPGSARRSGGPAPRTMLVSAGLAASLNASLSLATSTGSSSHTPAHTPVAAAAAGVHAAAAAAAAVPASPRARVGSAAAAPPQQQQQPQQQQGGGEELQELLGQIEQLRGLVQSGAMQGGAVLPAWHQLQARMAQVFNHAQPQQQQQQQPARQRAQSMGTGPRELQVLAGLPRSLRGSLAGPAPQAHALPSSPGGLSSAGTGSPSAAAYGQEGEGRQLVSSNPLFNIPTTTTASAAAGGLVAGGGALGRGGEAAFLRDNPLAEWRTW